MTIQKKTLPGDQSREEADALAVYTAALSAAASTGEELRRAVGLPSERFSPAVQRLLMLGLLHSLPGDDGRLQAVAPTTAVMRISGAVLQSMAEAQRQTSRLSSLMAAFTPAYTATLAAGHPHGGTERLMTLDAVRTAISELSAHTHYEILTSQPGGPRPEEQLREALGRTEDVLGRGVSMRTLYQRSAQFSQVTVDYVRYVTRLGARIRTLDDAFMRLIVFDRKTAIISLRAQEQGALLVHDPDIVEFVVQAYERAWAMGQPFPTRYERKQVIDASETMKQSITRLLVEGLEVAVIAKRLGVSPRTCQRHISEIMDRLGARNRLQAGYLIGQSGLSADLEPPLTDERRP